MHDAEPPRRLLLGILFLGAFTTAVNVTLLSPLLTRIAAEFRVSDPTAGQLATLTAGASGLTALLVAPWTDRFSRVAWLRVECSLLAIGSVLSALAPGFGWLFAGRILAGIGGAVIGANCLAAVSDLYAERDARNRALGLVNTAFTLGAVFGLPALTLVASRVGWRWAILAPAPLAAIVLIGTRWFPRAALSTNPTTVAASSQRGSIWRDWTASYRDVFRSSETLWLLGAMVSLQLVWFGWLIYFGAYAETVHAVAAGTLSLLFLAGGLGEIAGNNVAPLLLRAQSTRTVVGWAGAILAIDLLLVGVAYATGWSLFPFIVVASAAGAILFLCINILLLDSLPEASGTVMSLQSAGLELGGSLGIAVTGALLALLNDYEAVYRVLGLLAPLVVVCVLISTRRARLLLAG